MSWCAARRRGEALAAGWLAVCLCAVPLCAQKPNAKELNGQVIQLYKQGKYAEAIPLAQEAIRAAETEFGPEHPNVAISLNNLAAVYNAMGRFADAESLYRRALAISEKALGPGHPAVATSLNNLARLYLAQDRYAEAEPLLQRALAIQEKALGPDHPDFAWSLANLAGLYAKQGRYSEAEPLYKRALAIDEKARGPQNSDVATDLNDLALMYVAQGRYPEAEPLYQRSLTIYEKVFGPDHPTLATSLNNLAWLYDLQGRYTEAQPLYQRSLAIYEKAVGPDHPSFAMALSNLAGLYSNQGRYALAEPLYQRALAIMEKAFGPFHPNVAGALNNLARLCVLEGRYADAESLYKRALAIYEKALGPDNPQEAMALNNFAQWYQDEGRYAEAEALYKRALAIREKSLGPGHPDVAASLGSLSTLYHEQGRYAEAEQLSQRALTIYEKALGPDHPDVAKALNNLAMDYQEERKYAEAERLYKRALAIREKALSPSHPDIAVGLNNLFALYFDQGRYADAEPLIRRALEIREKALGPAHPDVALSLNNVAEIYDKEGRYAEAEPLLQRCLSILEKGLGPENPRVELARLNLALFYFAQGNAARAGLYFDRALDTLGRQFEYYFTYMSERERLAFLATVQSRFPAYFSFCLTFHRQFSELAGKMYDTVLWQKGFIARSAAGLRAKIRTSGDIEALRLLDELTAKKNALAKLAGAPPEPDPGKQSARRQEIEQLEKEANELEEQLVRRSSALGEEKRLEHVTWQQVRDALRKDEASVEIVRFPFYNGTRWTGESYYIALILVPQSQTPKMVVLGEAKQLEGAPLADYRRLVGEPDPDEPARAGVGQQFTAAFWQPMEKALGGAKRVYLSPDGVLSQVSLGVAPRRDGQLLMEAYDLRTVTSTIDLLRRNLAPASSTAVLVGNPAFDMSEEQQRAAVRTAQKTEAAAAVRNSESRTLRSRDLRGGPLNPLPGTQAEVDGVTRLLAKQGWATATYTQQNALEERVKQVHHPRVLHLATHGFFESDQQQKRTNDGAPAGQPKPSGLEDPMLRSGVYLAGANRVLNGGAAATDLDDGVLTAYEATQLDLQGTELVVLSACETGLGKAQAGEGVFGLQRGLQEAGAEAVLMSMWPVPDKETQDLMTRFYGKWVAGMDKHQALRAAQDEVRAAVRARDGRDDPFFWGAFVLVGR